MSALVIEAKRLTTPHQPPHLMLRGYMRKSTQLSQFHDELYKVTEDLNRVPEKFLIASSKQPILASHSGKSFANDVLPIKYAGYSTCYRPEPWLQDRGEFTYLRNLLK